MNLRTFKSAIFGIAWAATLAVAYHWDRPGGGESARIVASPPSVSGGKSTPVAEKSTTVPTGNIATTESALEDEGSAAAKTMTSEEYAAEFARIQTEPLGPLRNRSMDKLIGAWAMKDGVGALAAAGTISEPLLRYTLRETALRRWATADPETAWNHALANPNGDLPEERMRTVLHGLGRADTATALAFFSKHSNGELMPYMESTVGAFDQLYERGGHDLMVPWVQNLPEGKMKDGAVNRIVDQWARYDPLAAAQWMNSMIAANPKNTVEARIELAESWARVNPTQALAYVQSLPPDQQNNAYYERIFKRWLDYDKQNAAAYLAEQPASPALDRPFERYAYDVMNQNPAATMPWVESISDPGRRWNAMERVADAWRKKDPEGLNAYVSGATHLNEDQRAKLLRLKKK